MLVVKNRKKLDMFFPFNKGVVTDEKVLDTLKDYVDWLNCHNKNYIKEQEWRLVAIQDILRFIMVGGKKREGNKNETH